MLTTMPSDLDKAAEEWLTERENLIREKYYPSRYNAEDVFYAFKAGAEWMAKQTNKNNNDTLHNKRTK